jgi:hypothetical protein
MTQLTLLLPDGIQTYIDEQLSQGGYRTAEDFVIQLILESQTRSGAIAEVEVPSALQAFQNAGLVGCVEMDPTDSYKTIVQDYVIQKHQQNQGGGFFGGVGGTVRAWKNSDDRSTRFCGVSLE